MLGGTLDAFINFRLHLINYLLTHDRESEIICAYFGNPLNLHHPKIDEERVKWVKLEGAHNRFSIVDFALFWRLIKLFLHEKPDYALAFNAKPIFYIGFLKLFRIAPKNTTALLEGLGTGFRSFLGSGLLDCFKQILLKSSFIHVKKWIFLNSHDHRLFKAQGILGKTTTALQINGIGVDFHTHSHPLSPTEIWQNKSVGFCGRLVKEKGIDIFAEIAQSVKSVNPEIKFNVAGSRLGILDKALAGKIDEWLAKNHFDSLEYFLDVRNFFDKQSIIILPTRYNEGLPSVAMECQILGIPIIMNNIAQVHSAIPAELSHHLIQDNDVNAYTEYLLSYFSDFERFSYASEKSKNYAQKHFDSNKANQKIYGFMTELPVT